jgi:hypothetical protein
MPEPLTKQSLAPARGSGACLPCHQWLAQHDDENRRGSTPEICSAGPQG